MGEKLIGVGELAEYIGIPKATIYDWRKTGRGPAAYWVGKHLRYRIGEVDAWLEQLRDGRKGA